MEEPTGDVIRDAGNNVAEAEDARASDYAPKEMREAREKVQAAQELSRKARSEGNAAEMEQARWLAEEASAEAKLAQAKAQNTRMQGLLRDRQRPPDVPTPTYEPIPDPVVPPPDPVVPPPPGNGN